MPTPCESCPLRLASTRLSATCFASAALLPAARRIAAPVSRSSWAWRVFVIGESFVVGRSHHGADLPRHEFVLAVAVPLALARLARRGGEHQPEDALTHLGDRRAAVDDLAAIDVHVLFLPL